MNEPEKPTAIARPSPPETTAATPPSPPVRPIAPEVQELLNHGYRLQRSMAEIRTLIDEAVISATTKHPEYVSQIAEILEGHSQRLHHAAFTANLARRRNAR